VQILLHLVCAAVYATAVRVQVFPYLRMVGWTTVIAVIAIAGGYLLNNVADHQGDAYKARPFFRSRHEVFGAALLSVASFALALSIVHLLAKGPWMLVVAWSQLGLGVAYSVPPIRLKERGILGVISAAAAQRLPNFLMLAVSVPFDTAAVLIVSAWLLVLGLAFIVDHQLIDLVNDERSGTRTWVRSVGRQRGLRARRWLYGAFIVASGALAVLVAYRCSTLAGAAVAITVLAVALALVRAGERHFDRHTGAQGI